MRGGESPSPELGDDPLQPPQQCGAEGILDKKNGATRNMGWAGRGRKEIIQIWRKEPFE